MKKENLFKRSTGRGIMVLLVIMIMISLTLSAMASDRQRIMQAPPPDQIQVIIIGDRVVDIAYNLKAMPVAMSVRGSLWEMADTLKTMSQILGCPNFVTVKKKNTIPGALKKFNIKSIIVEKSPRFCLYKPKVRPDNIAPIVKGWDVKIDYVDFSKGLESAVRQTGKLLNREIEADLLIKEYKTKLSKVKAKQPGKKINKKVLILSGAYQQSTGKSMLRVEAPGGYSDYFFLEPMGCINVGGIFKSSDGKLTKGHYAVKRQKRGSNLKQLIQADPDIIVLTGNAYAAQKHLAIYLKSNPALADVTAIKHMAVYSLPFYIGSSVMEFPDILLQWTMALSR